MDNRQQRTLKAFESVIFHLRKYPVDPEPPLLIESLRALEETIGRVQALAQAQREAARGVTGPEVQHLRQHLRRNVMMPLVRVAKPRLAFAPGTERVLHVPHARTSTAMLASHALEMVKVLAPHVPLLEPAGFSAAFMAEFERKARRLAAVSRDSEAARQRRSRATADIRREIASGMATLGMIEGMVMAGLPDRYRAQALRNWRELRRVPGRIGRPPKRKRRPSGDPGAGDSPGIPNPG